MNSSIAFITLEVYFNDMPMREIPLVNDNFYHVFNRGINKQSIFYDARDYQRALDLTRYYKFKKLNKRFSQLIKMPKPLQQDHWKDLDLNSDNLVEIICFCLMPNHFHFILKQVQENGVSKFMSNFQNSYTRYFNTRHHKFGPILQGQFKSVFIENDEYLLHLSRYIHLNPYTSNIIKLKKEKDIEAYPWSSFQEYVGQMDLKVSKPRAILDHFKHKNDYNNFVLSQADYQREIKFIEHLIIEDE